MNRKTVARVITLLLALVLLIGIFAGTKVLGTVTAAEGTEIIVGDSEAVSVGIIGGADGPTAIFVSGNPGALIAAVVVVIAAIVAVVVIMKKRKK